MMDIARHPRGLLAVALAVLTVLAAGAVLAACGGDDESATPGPAAGKPNVGNSADLAFVRDMIPHHRSAVTMAKIAQTRGQSDFVKDLAEEIVQTQNREITALQAIGVRLDDAGVEPGDLGVPSHQMGMDGDVDMLETADPFDREFIDMMVPHHQGAIRMARAEIAKGGDADSLRLAEAIVKAQATEIMAMNEHRTETFGSPSPAGGVPDAGSHGDEGSTDDHSSGSGSH